MQSQVRGDSAFQRDSQVVVIAWCASSAAALDLIGSLHTLHLTLSGCVTKNGAKTTPEGKAEALVDAICQCHEESHSLRLPFPPAPLQMSVIVFKNALAWGPSSPVDHADHQ